MKIKFNKGNGLVPVIIQDYLNMQVLMLGYMNEEAFNLTQKSGIVTFYSRSKNRIWQKGETSNNRLLVKKIDVDCDNDTLLILAQPMGPTCHTGSKSCFKTAPNNGFLFELEEKLNQKINGMDPNSYTYDLYKKGINKIAQKVGEEVVELVIESKDNDLNLFKNEAADLIYHFLILLKAKNTCLKDIEDVLIARSK